MGSARAPGKRRSDAGTLLGVAIAIIFWTAFGCLTQPLGAAEPVADPANQALTSADLTLLVLAATEQRAVVRTADGELLLVAAGDRLPGELVTVRQILTDRLVLSERQTSDRQRLVWLYPVDPESGRSPLRYLDRQPPPTEPALMPAMPAPDPPQTPPPGDDR